MATFQTRIEDIIGTNATLGSDDASANTQAMDDALSDAANEILSKIKEDFITASMVTNTNSQANPIASGDTKNSIPRIVSIQRLNSTENGAFYVDCVYRDHTLFSKLNNPNSIYYATAESPVWTIYQKEILVFPTPSSSAKVDLYYVPNPTVSSANANTSNPTFPQELLQLIVLGAAFRLKQRQITYFNEDEDGEVVALHRAQYQEILAQYNSELAPYLKTSDA